MTKKPIEVPPAPAKPVIAVEYNGTLYPSFQKAEGARAKSDLIPLLSSPKEQGTSYYAPYGAFITSGEMQAIDRVIDNAERIHGILSRYLDAAKIETPKIV